MVMEDAEAIAERQDKANHMQFGHVDETFNDLDAKYEETYQEFKKIWIDNPSMSKKEAFNEMGRTYNPDGFLVKHVNKRLVEDGLPLTHKKEISFEVKESSITDDFEELYQQFKELWVSNPTISKTEVFKRLNKNQTNSRRTYINERLLEDGLPINHEVTNKGGRPPKPVVIDNFEEKYREYKKLFETSTHSVDEIYSLIHVNNKKTNDAEYQYILNRCKEDGLNAHVRRTQVEKAKEKGEEFLYIKPEEVTHEELEEVFQEYKQLFLNTDLPISEVRKKVGAGSYNNELGKYITKRCKEENLNGRVRRKHLEEDKKSEVKEKPKKKKVKSKKTESPSKPKTKKKAPKKKTDKRGVHNACNYSEHTLSCIANSKDTFNKFFADRNIQRSTQKGYEATFHKWFQYHGTKYDSIQDCFDLYMDEEDKRIPMRDRTIKKELIGFRESLIDDTGIKSDKSVRSYFSKMGSLLRHYGLEIPDLPKVKLEKGYVSSYNDLPTHSMIKTACEQSPLDLKALILFMSSSGSAKAETLSITVEMFLTGCNEYLEEPADATNIQDTLNALSDKHDIVPLIYLRRIKTDKWYYTCCSPEASYMIIESLKTRKNLEWSDKLFDYTGSLILTKFQEINDNNNWGHVGAYRRFRSHALRKFMASNIGLPRDQVDSFQGRAKDMIQEAYFKQDPQSLKKIYLEAMHRVMIYENWGHGTTPSEIEQRAKRLKNGFNDNEKILDLSVIPETPEEIKSTVGLRNDNETLVGTDKNTRNVHQNSANTMPVTAPVQMPTGMIQGISISKELLQYAELMEKGLLSIGEFNRIKQTLLMSVIR